MSIGENVKQFRKQFIGAWIMAGVVVLGLLIFQAIQSAAFLNEVMYRDAAGATLTRQHILRISSQRTLEELIAEAVKQEKAKASAAAPAPASPVK